MAINPHCPRLGNEIEPTTLSGWGRRLHRRFGIDSCCFSLKGQRGEQGIIMTGSEVRIVPSGSRRRTVMKQDFSILKVNAEKRRY